MPPAPGPPAPGPPAPGPPAPDDKPAQREGRPSSTPTSPNQLSVDEVLQNEQQALSASSGNPAGHSALCISGGGIRSATFGLGALQALAQHGLLDKFDYLSTVSGGGYIGSWLTAWIHRKHGIGNVIPGLVQKGPQHEPDEPDPIGHLREYNNYLSPRVGAFSVDFWTLISTILRNIALNWMVLIPLLMSVLMLPRLYLSIASFPNLVYERVLPNGCLDYATPFYNPISNSFIVKYGLLSLYFVLFTTALFNTLRYLPSIGGRPHSRHDFAVKVLAPLIGAVFAVDFFSSLYYLGEHYGEETGFGETLLAVMLPCVTAWALFLLWHRRVPSIMDAIRTLMPILALAAGTGLAMWALIDHILWSPDCTKDLSWPTYVTLAPATSLIGFLLGGVLFVGLSSRSLKDEDREWMARATAGVLLVAVGWAGLCAVVLLLPEWAGAWHPTEFGFSAIVGGLSAWLSSKGTAMPNTAPSLRDRLMHAAKHAAPFVFIIVLAGALSILTNILLEGLGTGAAAVRADLTPLERIAPFAGASLARFTDWREHYQILEHSGPILLLILAVLLAALGWLMAHFVNINTFSLHGMYRDRIVRAYLGASNADRIASGFTGFSNNDDIQMSKLQGQRPFHVINLTLNLVAGTRLAWQQRKAAPFTVTPSTCGSAELGYRPSAEYANGISLGTAVAVSGAAASPNMGYHSSPAIGFIMTLFNARLGVWLGNPGPQGERTWKHSGPTAAVRSLVNEALGQTSDHSEYIYLSDGGHFENLGLYEMVRRRCRSIVVLDAGCDPEYAFEDLGNAIRKIEIDFGIPITFDPESLRMLREKKHRWALATLEYKKADEASENGRLIYIKPMLRGDESPDVKSYAASHEAFPHESTGDQWFDESQTESYRHLGASTVDGMCQGKTFESLDQWIHDLEATHAGGRSGERHEHDGTLA